MVHFQKSHTRRYDYAEEMGRDIKEWLHLHPRRKVTVELYSTYAATMKTTQSGKLRKPKLTQSELDRIHSRLVKSDTETKFCPQCHKPVFGSNDGPCIECLIHQ